jgi:hypothetical protein
MVLFADVEPTPEQAARGYEADPGGAEPCVTYAWIGQDFAFCERCSKPCWEHPYEPGFGDNAGLRARQMPEDARRMWEKWGEPKGIEYRAPKGLSESMSPRERALEELALLHVRRTVARMHRERVLATGDLATTSERVGAQEEAYIANVEYRAVRDFAMVVFALTEDEIIEAIIGKDNDDT